MDYYLNIPEWNQKINLVLNNNIPRQFIQNISSDSYFITGGFVPRACNDLPGNDIDIFFRTNEAYVAAQQVFTSSHFLLESQREYLAKYRGVDYNVDLVAPGFEVTAENFRQSAKDFVSKFDFTAFKTICVREGGVYKVFTTNSLDFQDIQNKKLRYTRKLLFRTPANNTLLRMKKYMNMGFTMASVDYENIVHDLHSVISTSLLQDDNGMFSSYDREEEEF